MSGFSAKHISAINEGCHPNVKVVMDYLQLDIRKESDLTCALTLLEMTVVMDRKL